MGAVFLGTRERVEMRAYLILILIVALFVDIGLSKPLSRKKRQLNGTGVSGGVKTQRASSIGGQGSLQAGSSLGSNVNTNALPTCRWTGRGRRRYQQCNSYCNCTSRTFRS